MTGRALVMRGDAAHIPMPDASVDLIVTSPPYFALRSYTDGGVHYPGQIGSEPTPADYIDALIDCTAEWMRVLKPSGSMFVDLGDKYGAASWPSKNGTGATGLQDFGPKTTRVEGQRSRAIVGGREKCLLLLPERYRIAAVDRLGLIARAVIIWMKPNGLPESVGDRVRRSHEDWVHLVRQPRYYSAVDEIRETYSDRVQDRQRYAGRDIPARSWSTDAGRNDGGGERGILGFGHNGANPLGKLPGSVWSIPTEPLQVPPHLGIDHFAAFPSEWCRRLILGWSPPGICTACGEGRRPVTDSQRVELRQRDLPMRARLNGERVHGPDRRAGTHVLNRSAITGYVCACPEPTAPTRPSVVLDPFGGTGTTSLVASVLGRIGITVDRSADYSRLAAWRTQDPGERARALRVEKPAPVAEAQLTLDWEIG